MTNSRPGGQVHYDNTGRVVLVTGGSSGIGRAICTAFADSGADVACLDIRQPETGSLPSRVEFIHCDTSSETDCRDAVAKVVGKHDAIDVLVNNAAIQPKESYHPIDAVPPEVWQQMIAVNFVGYMTMARQVLGTMKRQRSGVIVNMASGQAHRTAREVGVYGPIKSGNVMQARQWAVEYAREGIRVVSVSPGAVDTPLVRASLEAQGGGRALANRHPLGRIGRAEEIAGAVLWLASSDASFVTGTDLEVDGGLGAFGAFADPYALPDG
jgi:NAD(P)-dependent dehydrogenase (short-subunit alcohol dehydrogenase family)